MTEKMELRIRREELKRHLSLLNWRRNRAALRCDELMKEIDNLTCEIAAIEIIDDMVRKERKQVAKQLRMEIL